MRNREIAEQIYSTIDFDSITDHPNILIAARFWDNERYDAARVFYRCMRYIDDLIDDHKAGHKEIGPHERDLFIAGVNSWLSALSGKGEDDRETLMLRETIGRFRLPLWPLEEFARSMIYDINHSGFATLQQYIDYSQGASVAPASVFVHLCGLRDGGGGEYLLPQFDVRSAATPCALFSYLVHIIRDFQKDQHNNLNYFAGDMLEKYGLTAEMLREMAFGKPVNDNFRRMIAGYMVVAEEYRLQTQKVIEDISPFLDYHSRLSLHIIFSLYHMVWERIDVEGGSFLQSELEPTPADIRHRVGEIIDRFACSQLTTMELTH